MKKQAIGVLSVGVYLPEETRKNDWWPSSAVETWPQRMASVLRHTEDQMPFPMTEGVKQAIDSLRSVSGDPFLGVRERRVMPDGMLPHEMEIRAAEDCLGRAAIDRHEIGIVMVHSMVPSFHTFNGAAPVHHALGLSKNCFVTGVDSVCNSFITQLELASALLQTGRARYALLVQSSAVSRIADTNDWYSAFLGDGATAVLVGPVAEGRGYLGSAHRVSSENHMGILTTGEKGSWWQEGRCVAKLPDKEAAKRTLFQTQDLGKEVILDTLETLGLSSADVDFYASHQAAGNLRRQTQELAGMTRAKFIDTLPWAGTLSSANIPLQLACASRDNILRSGDLVAMFSMGAGSVVSAAVMRWGS
jgi:3-oxoacyl-[acyl-carrier-protein] synthase III